MGFLPSSLIVPSRETGTDYRISVAAPDPAVHPGPWRVVLVLDADDHFRAALDAYHGLWARGQGRPCLLVGVGYGAGFKQPGNRRLRDYTVRAMPTDVGSGGGDAFHDFLTRTLWPRLARLYPIDSDEPALVGHSLGALFVLHAVFRADVFFRRAVAVAPSLWWDERATLRDVAERHAAEPRLAGRLYLAVGETDTESMRADVDHLVRQLREYPFEGLRLTAERFPQHGHFDIVPPAYAAGLRAIVSV